jgi:AraC-like DNA-binding protein
MASFIRRLIQEGRAVSYHEPIRPLFESTLVRVGSFRCPVAHPRFRDSGPTRSHLFVFPRTSVWIEQEGRRPFVSDPTHAVLYNPRHNYVRRPISPDGDRSDFFGVAASLHREMQAAFEPAAADAAETAFRVGQAPADAATYRLQRRIFEDLEREPMPEAMAVEESVIEVFHRILASLYCERPAPLTSPRHRDLAQEARAYLAANFTRKQSLTEVARALDCSVFHLCRVFRKDTGMTLHEYRQQLRVRLALESVTSDQSDLLEVALRVGYSGHSHFTAAFREAFGAPPSALRSGGSLFGAERIRQRDVQPASCRHPRSE